MNTNQSFRCPVCCTSFCGEDYYEHRLAHIQLSENPKQRVYELKRSMIKTDRHAPDAGCNCPFYGLRDYCEVLKLEAA